MKKSCLLILAISIFATGGLAQTRSRYVFDNFDSTRGVQVSAPTPVMPARSLVKKTSQQKMRVQDSVGLTGNPLQSVTALGGMRMAAGTSMNGFTTGIPEYDSYIVEASLKYGVDPLLIYSQMHQESAFKVRATSNKGASGLMQLMPGTAARFGVTNIYDPRQNIDAGVKYMRWLLDKFGGDVALALAGYNAGEGAVMKYGYQIPPYNETQEYVRRISSRYFEIRNIGSMPRAVVKKVTTEQVAAIEKKAPAPLTVYEPSTIIVRTPDGRMRLVSQ